VLGFTELQRRKKQNDDIPMKRKSLDNYKVSLTESKKRPLPRTVVESIYDEILESDSIDELNDSPNVSFLAEYPEPDIKLRIKKKDPASKTIKSNKKSRSKELYNTIMVKKAKSKEDIPSNDSKKIKPPLLRRRSKSNDAGRIPKDAEKRSKKKGDSSSDELEKDLIKAISKKKKRNSMNSKYPNDPSTLTLRSTMNESLLSKNSKSKKTKSEASSQTSSLKSGSDKDGNNAKSRSTSTENNPPIKAPKPLSTIYPGTSLLSSDFTSTDRVDKLQSPKTSPYVFKKQH